MNRSEDGRTRWSVAQSAVRFATVSRQPRRRYVFGPGGAQRHARGRGIQHGLFGGRGRGPTAQLGGLGILRMLRAARRNGELRDRSGRGRDLAAPVDAEETRRSTWSPCTTCPGLDLCSGRFSTCSPLVGQDHQQ